MDKLETKQYTFWELLQKVGIKIPIIQRDYAQGRTNKRVESIRDNFVAKLFDVLTTEKTIDLDFVYGTVQKEYLIPLDGQQRLTTLFLLHYYLASKDKKLNDKNKKILQKFTYETRLSSREFIALLVEKGIDFKENEKISTTITNQTWFFSEWENDPTIRGMLVMLDSIEKKFKNIDNGLFEKLISEEPKQITFSFLNLDEFELTDELYIKMNARGKPLTEFENFKSRFESFITDINTKAKLDNSWYDIFWKMVPKDTEEKEEKINPAKKADELFLNFFKNITAFYSESFDEIDIFKFDYSERVNEIEKVLDCLTKYKDNETDTIRKKLEIFEKFLKTPDDISYSDRLKFYSLMRFFLKKDLPSENKDIFKSWVRVNINLIHNTAYDSITDYKNNIKLINKLEKGIDNLYDFLSTNITEKNISDQLKEEIKKARIIKSIGKEIEDIFIEAERHPYLDGEIGFLIDYSLVGEKFRQGYFIINFDKFKKLWKYTSIKKNNTLLHRALLTYGNYLPKRKNSNKYTFGSFGGERLREKNENFRKIFKTKEFETILKGIKTIDNIELKLKEIIDNFKFDCDDWRSYFINPGKSWTPISYANNYQIKIENNKVFLNDGNTSGATGWGWSRVHELYSIYLLELIKEKLNYFEVKPDSSSDIKESYPHISIDEWQTKDGYIFKVEIICEKENFFTIEFYEKNNQQIPDKIVETLKENGFQKDDKTYNISIYSRDFEICEQNELIDFLKSLLNKFEEIENDSL